jgi:hypothetical protein
MLTAVQASAELKVAATATVATIALNITSLSLPKIGSRPAGEELHDAKNDPDRTFARYRR